MKIPHCLPGRGTLWLNLAEDTVTEKGQAACGPTLLVKCSSAFSCSKEYSNHHTEHKHNRCRTHQQDSLWTNKRKEASNPARWKMATANFHLLWLPHMLHAYPSARKWQGLDSATTGIVNVPPKLLGTNFEEVLETLESNLWLGWEGYRAQSRKGYAWSLFLSFYPHSKEASRLPATSTIFCQNRQGLSPLKPWDKNQSSPLTYVRNGHSGKKEWRKISPTF